MRWLLAPLLVACLLGCNSPEKRCAKFVELSVECDGERREVTKSICVNAYKHVGERGGDRHARHVKWLNATLRLQAECASRSFNCEQFEECTDLRAPR